MHLVYIANDGQWKQLQDFYSWPIVLGAAWGFLRLVVDVLRFAARFGFMRRAVEREHAKKIARAAPAPAPAPAPAAVVVAGDDAQPEGTFSSWWPQR